MNRFVLKENSIRRILSTILDAEIEEQIVTADNNSTNKKRVAILSNITVDLIIGKLRNKYVFYQPNGFDAWVQDVIYKESDLYKFNADAIVLLIDGTEAREWNTPEQGDERLNHWMQATRELVKNNKSVPIFVSTIDIRLNRIISLAEKNSKYELQSTWYEFVIGLVNSNSNVFVFDIADIIGDYGRNQFYSNKMWYMSSMPYSRQGLSVICDELDMTLGTAFTSRKKIVALDLDNTLWGGVIGEDGIEDIELSNHKEGQRFYDFQRQLFEMKNRGLVLGIVSKNNEEDAENVLKNHPSMILRDADFVCKKINWENKAANLKAMETELNITESGFVFIDDNPVERETVKGECQEIAVPEFPTDSAELIDFAEQIWRKYCRPLRVLEEDKKKTIMYQNEAKRNIEKIESLSLEDYIKKLEIEADIHIMRPTEKERVIQLINKTNQFNLTTKRYTATELEMIAENEANSVYVVYCSDKYGDSGLVSVIILMENPENVRIDSFFNVLSCDGKKS
jgi:FkbH-like protein